MLFLSKGALLRYLSVPIAFALLLAITIAIGPIRVRHPQYLLWTLSNAPCPESYIRKCIYYDDKSDNLVKGDNAESILRRFPFAKDADSFPSNDLRRVIVLNIREREEFRSKLVKMYFLDKECLLAILIVNGKGVRLGLFKG